MFWIIAGDNLSINVEYLFLDSVSGRFYDCGVWEVSMQVLTSKIMLNNKADKQSFMRLPKIGGRCPHTGLSRTTLTCILKSGNVRSHTVQLPGRSRGCRVIDVQSLLDYIGSCPNKPTKNNERRSYA